HSVKYSREIEAFRSRKTTHQPTRDDPHRKGPPSGVFGRRVACCWNPDSFFCLCLTRPRPACTRCRDVHCASLCFTTEWLLTTPEAQPYFFNVGYLRQRISVSRSMRADGRALGNSPAGARDPRFDLYSQPEALLL